MGLSCEFEKLHRSFQHEMARYTSNFGNKLQMMVRIAKEYGFASNFDILRPFTPRKTELPHKMVNSQSDCRTALSIPDYR